MALLDELNAINAELKQVDPTFGINGRGQFYIQQYTLSIIISLSVRFRTITVMTPKSWILWISAINGLFTRWRIRRYFSYNHL